MERRETVGKISRDLLLKNEVVTHSAEEQMREQLTDYEKNVIECIEKHKKIFTDDFYVIVETKKEKLMSNVIRSFFFGRLSCPTPNYDQTVYKYDRLLDKLELIWVIPDRISSKYMAENVSKIPPEKYSLLSYVLKFADGTLFKLSKELNGEKDETCELKE